ncbi:flavin-dependent L-tryptophan oxidase RebO precursor [Oxobacter pfennigii]|uniref:Flavin-dependent L-tryptophan oxidase RebO n=1 Tax=Oxobacter pfennigii TaxID=36849 RepID=A0A0P8Y8Q9_9CLOT|nr:FAD-dependent oxidoreductase [Oxobacter pfennigii]KPU43124.1 flavin-dependent L-tryptophan oxidase RebO precursor [Oxobacter pfennigii]
MHYFREESNLQPSLDPENPTDIMRHDMLYNALVSAGRADDYRHIVSLLVPPQDITNCADTGGFKDIKVGIIGGGLSGMAAAFELRKLGYDITIFEPNTERIGGRIYTHYFDKDKGLYGELGAMRFPISHETTWHYINLFKLNTAPLINRDPKSLIFVRNVRVRNDTAGSNITHNIYPLFDLNLKERSTPWPHLFNHISDYYLSTLPPEIRKQFLTLMPRYDSRFERIINMSIRQAISQYGLSSEAINLIISIMPIIGSIMDSSYEATLNNDYTMDFLNLYYIPGGMVKLPMAFYKSLTSPDPEEYPGIPKEHLGKVTWKRGFAVYGIYKSERGGKVVLKYRPYPEKNGDSNLYENFDYVICAIPLSLLRLMDIYPYFSGKKMEAIRDVNYYDSQKTLFLCSERFWEKQGIYGGSSYTDRLINIISYPQDHASQYRSGDSGVLLASYNAGQDAVRLGHTISTEQYRIIRENVEQVHGLPDGYLNNIVKDVKTVDWVNEPWAKGGFQMLFSGSKVDFLYISSTPEYDNRVFFAGEHASTKNAWIQGSLQSAMQAANSIAHYSQIHRFKL